MEQHEEAVRRMAKQHRLRVEDRREWKFVEGNPLSQKIVLFDDCNFYAGHADDWDGLHKVLTTRYG